MGKYEVAYHYAVKCFEYNGNLVKLGRIEVFLDNIVGYGSNETVVFEGAFNDMLMVAVKRFSKAQCSFDFEGIRNHALVDTHPNIITLYGSKQDENYIYVAVELCKYNLHHLVKDDWAYAGLLRQDGYPSPDLLELIRGIVSGIKHLHGLRIIHGDLKPSRVLISKESGRICCMGSSRGLDVNQSSLGPKATVSGTLGWRSPEQILNLPQTPAMDVFSLGCVLFFILTRGEHPFGDLPEREINVTKNNIVNINRVEHIPEAKHFFSRLLTFEPELRPKASEVLLHPLFGIL